MESVKKTVAKNSASIAGADIILRVASFIFNILIIRYLGGADFGKYATIMAYVGIFAIFSDLGMGTYVTREIAQDKSKTGFLTWNTIIFRVVLSLIVIPIITISAILLGYPQETVIGILLASSALLLHAIYGPIVNLTRGYERLDLRSISHLAESIGFMVIAAIVLLLGLGLLWLIVGTLISVLAATIVGAYIVIKYIGRFSFQVNPSQWWGILKASLPFGAISLTFVVANQIDTVMLSLWMEDVVVGLYAVAYGLMGNLLFFSNALNGALGPTLARTYAGSKETVNSVYQTSFRMLFIISMPLAVGGTLLASQIVVLLYTDEFAAAVPAFQVLVWVVPLMSLHTLCSGMATAIHKEKPQAKIRVTAAIANIALNIYVIPRYGLMGAAVVTVVTELFLFILLFRLVSNQFVLQNVLNVVAKPIFAVVLMGIVVYLGRDFNLFLITGIGAVVYGLTLMVTKAINLTDPTAIETVLLRSITQRIRGFASGYL